MRGGFFLRGGLGLPSADTTPNLVAAQSMRPPFRPAGRAGRSRTRSIHSRSDAVSNILEGVHYFESILDTVGRTPLVRLRAVARNLPCPVLAKMETFNPGGSVKDRIGLAMVEAAENTGTLKPRGTIVDGQCGNPG